MITIVIGKVTVTETVVIGIATVTVTVTANVTDMVAGKTMAARDITRMIPTRILALKGGTDPHLLDQVPPSRRQHGLLVGIYA